MTCKLISSTHKFCFPVHLSEQCKLICKVAGSTAYYQLAKKVIDGTPCSHDKDDICVQGRCLVSWLSSTMSHHNLPN